MATAQLDTTSSSPANGAKSSASAAMHELAFLDTMHDNTVPSLSFNMEEAPISPGTLIKIFKALQSGGHLTLVLGREQDIQTAVGAVKLCGFVEATVSEDGSSILCRKPVYEVGSSVPLAFKARESPHKPTPGLKAAWQALVAESKNAPEERLVRDEDLLETGESAKPTASLVDNYDCGPGAVKTKKACKNCSCGKAAAEQMDRAAKAQIDPETKSSCGSCALGDAFRCEGCPSRGMPAFKAGEQVTLSAALLDDDI